MRIKKMIKAIFKIKLFYLLVIIFCFINTSNAETIKEKISFKIFDNWKLLKEKKSDSSIFLGYEIQNNDLSKTLGKTNAIFRANYIPKEITAIDIDVPQISNNLGATFLLSAMDGNNWKTSIMVGSEKDVQMIFLHRVGVFDGIAFEFLFMFPHISKETNQQIKSKLLSLNEKHIIGEKMTGIVCSEDDVNAFVTMFNDVSKSMKIKNHGHYTEGVLFIEPPSNADVYRQHNNQN
jgi:hypothetical protein